MLRKIRIPLSLVVTISLVTGALALSGVEAFAQLGMTGDEKPARPTDGLYLIKLVKMEDSLISAENIESKVSVAAIYTFDPLPGSEKKPAAPKARKGKKGKKKTAEKPAEAPKFVPSQDCKAWMMHVNWSPRVGDKVKLADAGACHLKGSFAGR